MIDRSRSINASMRVGKRLPRCLFAVLTLFGQILAGNASAQILALPETRQTAGPEVPKRVDDGWWRYFTDAPAADLAARRDAFILAVTPALVKSRNGPAARGQILHALDEYIAQRAVPDTGEAAPANSAATERVQASSLLELIGAVSTLNARRRAMQESGGLLEVEDQRLTQWASALGVERSRRASMDAAQNGIASAPDLIIERLQLETARLALQSARRSREREQHAVDDVQEQLRVAFDRYHPTETDHKALTDAEQALDEPSVTADKTKTGKKDTSNSEQANPRIAEAERDSRRARLRTALDFADAALGSGLTATRLGETSEAIARLERSYARWIDAEPEIADALHAALAELDDARWILAAAKARWAPQQGLLERTGLWLKGGTEGGLSSLVQVGHSRLFQIGDATITLFGMLKIVLILMSAYLVSWLARRALGRIERHRDASMRPAFYAVGRVLHYVLVVAGLMFALGSIGIDLSRVTLFVSALGVGLGFGMQAVISNFVSGLIILFERHLKIGDFVELESGVTGEVREINIRATRITTNDNIDVLVPNSEFVNGRVVNWTLEDLSRRIRVKFSVNYGADKGRVREAVLQAAATVPFTRDDMEHRPQVWLTGFGDSSLEFELVVWLQAAAVKRPATVHAAYCWAIDDALRQFGIEIPFPQRDLHVRSVFGLHGDDARRFVRGEPDSTAAHAADATVAPSANDALDEAVRLAQAPVDETPGAPKSDDRHEPH